MNAPQTPDDAIRFFYQSLRDFNFHFCWNMFSNNTQKEFLKWTLNDIYTRHPKAAKEVKIGPPEVKLMFEGNDQSLIQTFWRRFVQKSSAADFTQYAYYSTIDHKGKSATVQAKLVYPNGKVSTVDLTMVHERGGWKYAYAESGLPFR